MSEFQYLGSVIAENGRIDAEVDRCRANTSKVFGAMKEAVFRYQMLTLNTKRVLYSVCVLSILLYSWIPLRRYCIRTVMGISNRQQSKDGISSEQEHERWGDTETITTRLKKRRLEWLGHLAVMPDHRMPKISMFS